jgi:predicted lactoylglutathione lyase
MGDDIILLLHHQDAAEYAFSSDTDPSKLGHGVSLCFTLSDMGEFDAIHRRAVELGARVLAEPHFNEQAGHTEMEISDPDGYYLQIAHRDEPMVPRPAGQ